MAKVPGATGAHYDKGAAPTGTRTKAQRHGKVGTDDYRGALDHEQRHGEQFPGASRFYTDNPELVSQAQDHINQIVDRHAADPSPVTYKRADVLANQQGWESQYAGVDLPGGERSKVQDYNTSKQAKRGQRKA